MSSSRLPLWASTFAYLNAVVGFVYSFAFIVLVVGGRAPTLGAWLSALMLLLGGLLASAVLVALQQRVRDTDPGFALWALILGGVGSLGAAVHGGYDLAIALHPAANLATDLPNPVDPRGLVTFGVTGLGLLLFAWLMGRAPGFARGLVWLGYASGILSIGLYLGRLILLQPTNPVLALTAVVEGFVINPAFYLWLGGALRRT
jgi:hypothetical protein